MKFTLSWLKDHLESDAGLDQITDKLTAIGLEVEEVIDRGRELAAFTVGHVVEARQHPNADRLTLCLVDTGEDKVQVVCGAPNARQGMKGVFARAGLTVPGTGLELKASKIRGEASNGMLCSEREMGLSDEHEGIIELPDDAPIGAPFAEIAGLDDPVIDVAITPNRQDCTGVRGIARDLAAAGLGTLRPFAPDPVLGGFESSIDVSLDFPDAAKSACACFVGRYFRGLTNGPSPAWLQRRLTAVGLRPISALVDITNYVTLDLGRPLHVFDADEVTGNIAARLARPGETLLALDGKEYELDAEITVIADEAGPEGIAGVMGGEASGCTEQTTNVFLEVAFFDLVRTASTGRKLGIESDARYRFERGVDPAMMVPGAEHASRMILELCGGEASELVIAGAPPIVEKTVNFRPARVKHLGGVEVGEDDQKRILTDLGFDVSTEAESWQVAVPSWRRDVDGEADLVEEVMRIAGFDLIPAVPLPPISAVTKPALSLSQRRVAQARRALAARGLVECVTWSFVSRRQARRFGGGDRQLVLENPISSELDVMRPSLLIHLLSALARNNDRGFENVALFEVGPQYGDDTPEGQVTAASGVRGGASSRRHWASAARPVDVFDAKADSLAALEIAGAPMASLQVGGAAPDYYHPGRSGTIRLGPKNLLATFGEVHPAVLDEFDVRGPVAAFEAFFLATPEPRGKATKTRARLDVSDYQRVERDFAFVVADDVAAEHVLRAAKGAEKALIAGAEVFDVYRGPGIGEGEKSVAISLRLEPTDKTLTDGEIDAVAERVVAAVAKATGARLRGES